MKNKKGKRCLCFFAFVIVICLCGMFLYDYHQRILYYEEWAFYNYGQNINNKKGNVDINILDGNYKSASKFSNSEIKVAIVDTGVDFLSMNDSENLVASWDFYNNDSTIFDDYLYDYHGTYITNMILKIAPRTKIIAAKFMEGTNGCIEDAVDAIKYSIEEGARVINCSWYTNEFSNELYRVIAMNTDVLFICAAGNVTQCLDSVNLYPATYALENVISVTAIDCQGNLAQFSGYGEKGVDLAAPGEYIKVELPELDSDYVDGTSIATAFVSGAACLVLSVNDTLQPYEIKSILMDSANKTESLEGLCESGGYLDVRGAIELAEIR